jgi:hypothetical protein
MNILLLVLGLRKWIQEDLSSKVKRLGRMLTCMQVCTPTHNPHRAHLLWVCTCTHVCHALQAAGAFEKVTGKFAKACLNIWDHSLVNAEAVSNLKVSERQGVRYGVRPPSQVAAMDYWSLLPRSSCERLMCVLRCARSLPTGRRCSR